MPNTPSGAPASASALAMTAPVATEVRGCPSCALTMTGHPAASADAVSPPGHGEGEREVRGGEHRDRPDRQADPAQVRRTGAVGLGHRYVQEAAVVQHLGEQAQLAGAAGHLAGQPRGPERGLGVGQLGQLGRVLVQGGRDRREYLGPGEG